MKNNSIVTEAVIIRWMLTLILLFVALHYRPLLVAVAFIAAFFCELYWYLWQKDKIKNDEGVEDMIKKIICFLRGHNWNKYSLVSSYPKKVCARCGYEENKEGKREIPRPF